MLTQTEYGRNHFVLFGEAKHSNPTERQPHMRCHVPALDYKRCVLLRGTVTACAPARAGKALCLSHPHDHSSLTAEANGSHTWGWDAFACFSNGESPAGFFTQVLGKTHRRKASFSGQNQLLKNSIQGPLSKTKCAQ